VTARRGSRPGDRRIRIELTKPREFEVTQRKPVRKPPSAAVALVVGFLILIAVGTALLALPVAAANGASASLLVALFTATSAVCVTGFAVVDTATFWSPFGQAVILGLIQVGGFGFMTGSTLILFLLVGRRTGLRDRMLVQESTGVPELGKVTSLVQRIAVFTLIAEGAGLIVLTAAFLARGYEPLNAGWMGLFHAISAFNNAGFDLMGDFRSLSGFVDDPWILAPIGILLVIGGVGFAIVGDVIAKRRWSRFALETKIVLLTTLVLLVGGAAAIGFFEWNNPATLGALPTPQRPLNALFEAATLRTAGFSSLATGSLTEASLFVVMALIFIGGASGSTAGGIKVNTFSILLVAIVSTARGRPSAEVFGRRIPHILIYRALSVALLSIAALFLVALGLEVASGGVVFVDLLFEAVSAIGTTGASTGITPTLPDASRLILIIAMFIGRLGPLTLVLALTARARPIAYRPAVETIRIG
jgi:trk system potassium uptake protein TrkH